MRAMSVDDIMELNNICESLYMARDAISRDDLEYAISITKMVYDRLTILVDNHQETQKANDDN